MIKRIENFQKKGSIGWLWDKLDEQFINIV